jgi:hypothetical protein
MRPDWRKPEVKLAGLGILGFSVGERRRITANVQLRIAARGSVTGGVLAAAASR